MALVKWSALVSEIKGVMSGTIFQGGRFGQIMKNRISGGGRVSTRWQAQKGRFTFVASQWRTLTPGQQEDWNIGAINYPYINKFGDPVVPSGYQLYNTLNGNLHFLLLPIVTNPSPPEPKIDLGNIILNYVNDNQLDVSYTASAQPLITILVYASPGYSTGLRSPRNRYRFLQSLPSNTASPVNIATAYKQAYGAITSGSRIVVKLTLTDTRTGENYGSFIAFEDIP